MDVSPSSADNCLIGILLLLLLLCSEQLPGVMDNGAVVANDIFEFNSSSVSFDFLLGARFVSVRYDKNQWSLLHRHDEAAAAGCCFYVNAAAYDDK